MVEIVNIAIDINTDKIKESVEEHAEEKVIESIYQDIKKVMFQKRGFYGNDYSDDEPLRNMVYEEIDKIIDQYKDTIIETAAVHLANKLLKTKKAKEMLEGVIDKEVK